MLYETQVGARRRSWPVGDFDADATLSAQEDSSGWERGADQASSRSRRTSLA